MVSQVFQPLSGRVYVSLPEGVYICIIFIDFTHFTFMGLQNIDDDDDDDDSEIYRHESDGDIREFFLVGVTAG